jgi:hypothetical protein
LQAEAKAKEDERRAGRGAPRTLSDWEDLYGISRGPRKGGETPVVAKVGSPAATALYSLSDYRVNGFAGGTYWLVPRESDAE